MRNHAHVEDAKSNNRQFGTVDRSIVAVVGGRERLAPCANGAPIRVLIAWRTNSTLGVTRLTRDTSSDILWLTPAVTEPKRLLLALQREQPDVLLLAQDIFDDLDSAELQQLPKQFADLRILLVAQAPTPELYTQVLRCRFHGVLPTNCPPDACPAAVRAISHGEIWLPRALLSQAVAQTMRADSFEEAPSMDSLPPKAKSPDGLSRREHEIAAYVQRGLMNKEIASELDITEDTVKKHMQSIFRKLGVRRRTLVALHHVSRSPKVD